MNLETWYELFPACSRADINFLLCELLHLNKTDLFLIAEPDPQTTQKLRSWLDQLAQGLPPQYIAGRAWFYGLDFYVDERVLIPRFDTEVLVEAIVRYLKDNDRVLDIGCGSGAIAITLKHLIPNLDVYATDISESALDVARINAARHSCQICFQCADLFPDSPSSFEMIVSNPPYIPHDEFLLLDPMVRDHEPKQALLADDGGLQYYKAIINKAKEHLEPSGFLAFEHGCSQQEQLLCLTKKAGFRTLEKGKDLSGRDRYLILQKRG